VPTISYRLHYGQSQTPVTEIVPILLAYIALLGLMLVCRI